MSDELVRLSVWESRLAADFASDGGGAPAWAVRCYEQVASTMDPARDLDAEIATGAAGVVLAKRQVSGRGRQGRVWVAPDEGFFATYVLTAQCELQAASGFSLAAGLAVRAALEPFGADVRLKWPNDLMSGAGEKFGGILIELHAAEDGRVTLLCGIGLNLRGAPDINERKMRATSLETLSGRALSPLDVAGPIGRELSLAWRAMLRSGFAPLREAWMDAALFMGERLTVDCGGEVITGVFVEIDALGRMVLEGPAGRTPIVSGHVIL